MNYFYSFVILHYNVIEETQKCVLSIKKYMQDFVYKIVVVDNASPNKSGNKLVQLYQNDDDVVVILNEKNLGFACGNNIGIDFARKNFQPDFVVVLNNDVCLAQFDFAKQIAAEWETSNFAVLGPQIITPDGCNQNPFPKAIDSMKIWRKEYVRSYRHLVLTYINMEGPYMKAKEFAKKLLKIEGCYGGTFLQQQKDRQENVKLHGACLIFSTSFFEKFDGFNPHTFMYVEEDILYNQCRLNLMKTIYNPLILVYHNENAATNSVSSTVKKKRIFYYKERIKSLRVLYSILNRNLTK